MPPRVVEIGRLTAIQRLELEGDEPDPFGVAHLGPIDSRRKERHVVVPDAEGRLIASVGMLIAGVEVGGSERFEVVGIGGVIVAPTHRGQGLSSVVLNAALSRAATLGPRRAMLFCHERLTGLYRRFGFQLLPSPVRVQQHESTMDMPQLAMWRPLDDGADWPDGAVVLPGLPF